MKLLAISSVGGHWVQMLRVTTALENIDIVYASTSEGQAVEVPDNKFYTIRDYSRKNKLNILKGMWELSALIKKEKPDVVLTTGAAPGIIALFVAKLYFKQTIWLDSIANVEELSMSGRLATRFADRVYTQWPSLAQGKIIYAGNVLS